MKYIIEKEADLRILSEKYENILIQVIFESQTTIGDFTEDWAKKWGHTYD